MDENQVEVAEKPEEAIVAEPIETQAILEKEKTLVPTAETLAMLEKVKNQMRKKFGNESVMTLSDVPAPVAHIPTQVMAYDVAVGIGGMPRGRHVELFGESSSGKTTLALTTIRSAQRAGGIAAYIDLEHALDPLWMKKLGIRVKDVLISQPDSGEDGLRILEDLIESNLVDVIVVDSVAAIVPAAEEEKEIGETTIGLQAKLMSSSLRKLTPKLARSKATVLWINQVRSGPGANPYDPTTSGGKALKFYASIRLEIARSTAIKSAENEVIGFVTRMKCVKNKMAPPFQTGYANLYFKKGFDFQDSILSEAMKLELIEQGGAWFTYGKEKFQGKAALLEHLITKEGALEGLKQQILTKVAEKRIADLS